MTAHETHQRQTETDDCSRDPPETDRDTMTVSRDPPETDHRDTMTAHDDPRETDIDVSHCLWWVS